MSEDELIEVQGASKKFCRSLKRSLWYGVRDMAREMSGREGHQGELRKDEFWAVKDVSFKVTRGECLGLIGPNGAGKSTLLKMLNGLIKPERGRITLRGNVGALIELGAGFNPVLSARENIYVNGSVLGFSKREIDRKLEAIVDFAETQEFLDTPVQNFSSGMKVRLGFAVAAQMGTEVLLIDEVLAVGDIAFRMKCFKHILGLKEAGTAIVLVSHNMIDINRVCDRVIAVSNGALVCNGGVGEGIAAYMRECRTRQQMEAIPNSNPIIRLQSAVICDTSSNRDQGMHTDEPLQVKLTIDSSIQTSDIRVRVSIENSLNGLVSAFSTAEDLFEINLIPGENTIYFKIPRLPLGIGHYTIACGIYGQEITDVYDFQDSVCEFSVVGPRPLSFGFGSDGLVRIAHVWEHTA